MNHIAWSLWITKREIFVNVRGTMEEKKNEIWNEFSSISWIQKVEKQTNEILYVAYDYVCL